MFHFKKVALVLLSVVAYQSIFGFEGIERFDVNIVVNKDRTISVTEKIVFSSLTDFRGLTKTIPTVYPWLIYLQKRTSFDIKSISIDSTPAQFTKTPLLEGYKKFTQIGYLLKIGNPNKLLSKGTHTFEIVYDSSHQIGSYSSPTRGAYDELYYNAIGTGWPFSIKKASVTIELPASVPSQSITAQAFYGEYFGQSNELQASIADRTINFSTPSTTTLQPEQGITILVAWPQGHLQNETQLDTIIRAIKDNITITLLFALLVIGLISFALLMLATKQKNALGVVIPLFDRPTNITADEARLLYTQNTFGSDDTRAFTARIIQLAVDGFITIEYANNIHTLKRTSKLPVDQADKNTLDGLFAEQNELALKYNSSQIQHALTPLRNHLAARAKLWFYNPWISRSILYAIGLAGILVIGSSLQDSSFLIPGTLLYLAILSIGSLSIKNRKSWLSLVYSAFLILLILASALSFPEWLLFILNGLLASYMFTFSAYTDSGKIVATEVAGLAMYLNFTEKERLKYLVDTTTTPSAYEHLLPYAIAVNAEDAWHKQFQTAFDTLDRQGTPYQPLWYTGKLFDYHTFGSSIASNISIASSPYAPGTTSGISSGGRVGGGGGGGGGGKW